MRLIPACSSLTDIGPLGAERPRASSRANGIAAPTCGSHNPYANWIGAKAAANIVGYLRLRGPMPNIIFCVKCAKRMRAELRIASADPEHRYYFSLGSQKVSSKLSVHMEGR